MDGYSTGRLLVAMLRNRGVTCLHVQSQPEMTEAFRGGFRAADYEVDIAYEPDVEVLAARLREEKVTRVIAGTESGVTLADTLSDLLGLPGNAPEFTAARRDKALMADAVRAAGLATPLGATVASAPEAVAWYERERLTDVVAKPLKSAGTDNIRFCEDRARLSEACEHILASANLYGEPNAAVLVQERLHGVEYYLNTVSHQGLHRTAELWRYVKCEGAGGAPVYDYEEPVEAAGPDGRMLRAFTHGVLDALGIRSGAAHTEVMVTARGPVLIETGARLGGATIPHLVEKFAGVSQASLFASALVDPASLHDFDDESVRWKGALRMVSLINHTAGVIRSDRWMSVLESLPTLAASSYSAAVGDHLPETVDLLTAPGYVYLAADRLADVERDYEALRALERQGLYTG
ncbi:hypothetical protein ACQKM2_07260 [Streptomyces sp. NPDC004126]|uniref:hypothetical protein n=1 Tax=Streptomyces sp. NPDC004126 TaxID=3390695 RepID=UPI003CFEC3EE